jgi:replicative DNA helicase
MPDDLPPLFGRDLGVGSVPERLPPSNIQAERALLGALLANNKAYDRVAGFLKADHFADPVHGRIYEAISSRLAAGGLADPVTLNAEFVNEGVLNEVGGTAYLSSLLTAMVGIINTGDYGRAILDTWMRRELIDAGQWIVDEAFGINGGIDATRIAADAISLIDKVSVGVGPEQMTTLNAAVDSALDAMFLAEQRGKPPGLSTGFNILDARLGGLEPGLVYTIAGRPGSGKSALGHQVALNVARSGVCVLELSLEMSAMQLGRRALCAASGVPLFVMKSGIGTSIQRDLLRNAKDELRDISLLIDDAGGQSPRQIAAKCRTVKRKNGMGLIMLDHLNLTKPDEGDSKHGPTFAIEKAAGMMLQIAKECNVPVLMLTQLSRSVEGRDDKRPVLSDLRQSGAIEENSYAVGFIYREEYYLRTPPEQKEGEEDKKFNRREGEWISRKNAVAGKAEVIWHKVRDGEPGTDFMRFNGPTTSFSER